MKFSTEQHISRSESFTFFILEHEVDPTWNLWGHLTLLLLILGLYDLACRILLKLNPFWAVDFQLATLKIVSLPTRL